MHLKELNNKLKKYNKSQEYPYEVFYPWKLFTLKHLKYLEVIINENSYTICKENNMWKVFVKSKNIIVPGEESWFRTESEACKHFYNKIMK